MMVYKVGDEVLVKARIIEQFVGIYVLKTQDDIVFNTKKENFIPIPDMSAEEAWETARKIILLEEEGGIPAKDMVEMFGVKFTREIIKEYSAHEVKAKIEAWEAEKEIKFGDIVMYEGLKCVVTRVTPDKVYTVSKTGTTPSYCGEHIKKLKKIGHHEEIDRLLKQIGGDE